MFEVNQYSCLSLVLKEDIFVFIHGRAEVRRGFSSNKAMLQNNIQEGTFVARIGIRGLLKVNEAKVVDA